MKSLSESCTCKQQKKMRRQACMSIPIAVYLLSIAGLSCLKSVDGRIAPPPDRRIHIEVVKSASDIGTSEARLPSDVDFGLAGTENRRRRPRRSTADHDFIAFRKFLHSIRKSKFGAGMDLNEDMVKRDAVSFMERGSTGNMIASKVKCGECSLSKQWIPVSKPGCRTNFVLAPTCMGMCETWEIPDVHPPFITTHHRVCRPTRIEYRQIRLRKCSPGVNNLYAMPIAQNCACMKCKSKNTACRPL